MQWYYLEEGKQAGPVEQDQITQMLSANVLTLDSMVWNSTMGQDWKSIKDIPELKPPPAPGTEGPVAPPTESAGGLRVQKREEEETVVHFEEPEEMRQAREVRVEVQEGKRRLFWGYSCPECGQELRRHWGKGIMKLILPALLVLAACARPTCERCDSVRRREMPIWDQMRWIHTSMWLGSMGMGMILSLVLAILIALIVFR